MEDGSASRVQRLGIEFIVHLPSVDKPLVYNSTHKTVVGLPTYNPYNCCTWGAKQND